MTTRRQFLKGILAGLALSAINPSEVLAAPPSEGEPVFLAVHLTGGNDALNTLVPHRCKLYRKARPNLGLSSKDLLTLENDLALHPSLPRLRERYESGKVLLVPGVGRDDHDRSHFRSSDIWHGAGDPGGDGWMAKLGMKLGTTPVSLGSSVSRAVACPGHPPVGLVGETPAGFPGSDRVRDAWFRMYRHWETQNPVARRLKDSAAVVEELARKLDNNMNQVKPPHRFRNDEFGKRFELAYRLLAGGFPAQILHLSAGKFDTHSGQLDDHAKQLAQFDHAAHTFLQNVKALGRPTTMLVYSEFGRRVAENFSGGTDHGAGGLAWLMGDGVEGGVTGEYRVHDLRDGDLPTAVHYRELYKEAIRVSYGGRDLDHFVLS